MAQLVANLFGKLGPELVRFLVVIADHAARNRVPVPQPIVAVRGAPAPQTAAKAD